MEKRNGDWIIKGSKRIFNNDFFEVNEDDVLQPDGQPGKYATVKMLPGVAMLPIDDEGNVYLTNQFRYAVCCHSLETPCGGNEEGDAESAAKRELKEELGIEDAEIHSIGRVEIDTSIVISPIEMFIARKLKFGKPDREGTEDIKTVKLKFEEAVEKVMNGEIKNALSCVLILKAWQFEQNGNK